MLHTFALTLPVAAAETAFVLAAVPALLLMLIWSGVTAMRILFPERPLPPVDPTGDRLRRALHTGDAVPVRVRDIVNAQRAQAAEVEAAREAARAEAPEATPAAPHPFIADLWLRRN